MAEANRTVIYGGLGLAVLASFWYLNQEPEKPKAPPLITKSSLASKDGTSDLLPEDFTARFSAPKVKLRNLFVPAVKLDNGLEGLLAADKDKQHIPSVFAGGESDWAFKGIAISNGVTMALFENGTNHQAGYVKEGEHWKTSRITQILVDKVVLHDDAGDETSVMRFIPTATASDNRVASSLPPVTAPGAGPGLNPASPEGQMIGPIGRPGRSFSFPPGIVISQ